MGTRRRQRSVRVTFSVSCLAAGSALVVAALPTRSVLWLSVASVLALLLAWAALRIMWTEVLQSRRFNAADRAAAASAYRSLFSQRAAEHAEFTSAMTERLAEAHLDRRELEGRLHQSQARVRALEEEVVLLTAWDPAVRVAAHELPGDGAAAGAAAGTGRLRRLG